MCDTPTGRHKALLFLLFLYILTTTIYKNAVLFAVNILDTESIDMHRVVDKLEARAD